MKIKSFLRKKVLSLVLCVAVMLSVMVLGAGAAFSDQAQIENTEAVDACSALNIIGGYEDGSYHPERNIKRSEITKMICVALNGGKEPTLAVPTTPTFTDVRDTADGWAEKYIESCVAQGIVSGVGGGRFSPAGNVTGSQLAKMLLVCLGYDADIEEFTGNAWETNVNVIATQKGIYEGLSDLDVSAALTRDSAAQMVWNALQATEVAYEYTMVSENGQLVSKITLVDKENKGTNDNGDGLLSLLEDKYSATIEESGIMTAVSKDDKGTYSVSTTTSNYTKVATDYSYLMGQKINVLIKDKNSSNPTVYGIYSNEDSTVVATGVVGDLDTVTSTNEKIKLDSTEYKIDTGADVYYFNKTDSTDTLLNLAGSHAGVQQAYSIKLIDNNGNGKVDRAIVTPFVVAEVTYVGTSSMTFQSVSGFATLGNKDVDDVTAYSGIAEDDWAIVYMDSDTVDGNYNVEKATIVTGEVAGTRNNGTEGLIDGTWYTSLVAGETFNVGDKVDVVTVGEYAFNVEISDTSATSADVLYVDGLEIKTGLNAGLNAKLYFTDGTSKEALISKIDGYSVKTTALVSGDDNKVYVSAGSQTWDDDATGGATNSKKVGTDNLVDKVYTFTTDGDKYEIKSISDTNKAGFKGYDTVVSYADKTLTLSNNGTAKIADDAVIFVEGDDDTKVVSGATVNAWGKSTINFTAANSIMMYSEANGFKYAQVGSLRLTSGNDIPEASGDTAYGYVTADPYLIKDGSTNYIQYTLWTADGEKTVREKASATTVKEGDFVSYNVGDGTTVKEVQGALTAGAVTAYADGTDINMVNADQSAIASFAGKLADDVTVVYVNTKDTKGVDGGKIRTASKNENGAYIANVMYKLDSDYKVEVLFVDVNNDLENDSTSFTLGSGATGTDITNALKAGNVTLNANLSNPAEDIVVPDGSTLTITASQTNAITATVSDGGKIVVDGSATIAKDSAVTAAPGATIVVAGNREVVGSNSLSSSSDIAIKVLDDNKMEYTLADNATATLKGTLELAGADSLKGNATLIGADGAVIKVYGSFSGGANEWKLNIDNTAESTLAAGSQYTWSNSTWNKASL